MSPERLNRCPTPDLLLYLHGPLLRQRLHDSTVEHRSIDPRKRDLVSQVFRQQRDHVAVPIAVQARRILELCILVTALRVFGDRKLKVERYTQTCQSWGTSFILPSRM